MDQTDRVKGVNVFLVSLGTHTGVSLGTVHVLVDPSLSTFSHDKISILIYIFNQFFY